MLFIKSRSKATRASAILTVVLVTAIGLIATVVFLKKASFFMSLAGINKDALDSKLQMESAREQAIAKIHRAVDDLVLESKLRWVGGPETETFNEISNTYATDASTGLDFIRASVNAQAYSGDGVLDEDNEFADFDTAFPSEWMDPDDTDSNYLQVKYTINALKPVVEISPQLIRFEYEFIVQTRAWGSEKFSTSEQTDGLVVVLTVRGAPFSQWALFLDSMYNQGAGILTFAGGDSSSQAQEVYLGPVHVNGIPFFYGSPVFNEIFRSGADYGDWAFLTGTDYTGTPDFVSGYQDNYPEVSLPTDIFNTTRLAAGDTSNTAATDNTAVTNSNLRDWLHYYAGGTMTANSDPLPAGIYVPYDDPSDLRPTGGIFVEGDAVVELDVVRGSEDFNSTQWAGIDSEHQGCRFQKIAIDHLTTGVDSSDVYIGTKDSCDITYVFNGVSGTPTILNSRLNGVVHVEGAIDELSGISRNQAAIARDFAMNIAAQGDIRIRNDIQYEDAQYVEVQGDGTLGSTVVADPTGEVGGSGIAQTDTNVGAIIDEESKTVLGIMSIKRNVLVHLDAPADMNVHAAIFAGNSEYYDAVTGYGCGENVANKSGCGFGYEGWNSEEGKGHLKLLGGISEYKSQTLGVLSTPQKGYSSRYVYDTRLQSRISPPAFPVSDQPQIYSAVYPLRTLRVANNSN
ncbi:MAG: hypothetical protein COV44_09180 [Deltaproteobacteria bacterium CG11_big_fil_rev_8_21_14_0_20_45_16]|nr:MAG: hypothetical protein COV44_09180 [Deltaproteobacteria bacterium CG11_big_fil_rev_8_21_14_0_20_45_16]